MSPRLALVINFSASGRNRFALASVVTIRPCSNSWVAKLARISRWCAALPPRRAPLVGAGMFSPALDQRITAGAHWVAPLALRGFKGVAPLALILLSLAEVDLVFVQVVVA